MLITDNSAERSPKAPSVFVLRSAVSAWWECNQKYFYRHAISDSPLLETNNKLKHSLPSVASYSNVCMCLCMDVCTRVHLCARPNSTYAMNCGSGIKILYHGSEVQRPFSRKRQFFLHPFLHIPFLWSMDSLAVPLKLERRNTGWTGRTNSSHALWLLDCTLFSTRVLDGYSESAFLVINRASAGFHLDYLNMP